MDQYHHGDLRQRVLERCLGYFSRPGENGKPESLSLRALAREEGVSATAVYHHFPSKEALLEEAAVQLFHELLKDWQHLDITGIGNRYIGFFRKYPGALDLLFGPQLSGSPRIRELQTRSYELLVSALPPAKEDSPDTQAFFLWSLVHGLASLAAAGAIGIPEEFCPGSPAIFSEDPERIFRSFIPFIERILKG